jgi:hypothetical protein
MPAGRTSDDVPDLVAERRTRRELIKAQLSRLITAIRDGNEESVEKAVVELSQTKRYLAPLGFAVGAFVMLFNGLKLVVTNWRLTLVQILPAMWIWAAMFDLKIHVVHGKEFRDLKGPAVLTFWAAIVVITATAFFLNAAFAAAIARQGPPDIGDGFAQARANTRTVLSWGAGIGVALGVAVLVSPHWGRFWFALTLSIMIGVMMICYVAVPGRITGATKRTTSRRDNLASAAVGGAVGAAVCAPPYLLGRLGLVLLGSHALFPLGVALLIVGIILYTGTTTAVKAVKMSTKLITSGRPTSTEPSDQVTPTA